MGSSPMVAGVIGWPVAHSLSPRIHAAAAESVGIDLVYTAIEIEPGKALDALVRMRTEGIRGYSVTMPHKEAVIPGLDEVTTSASVLGAVNHITNSNGHLVGNNTDGDGFVLGFQHSCGQPIQGATVGVLGSGGAARAIIEACYRHGATEVVVVARSEQRAAVAAALAKDIGRVGTHDELSMCDVVVNATSVGMAGTGGEGQLIADVDLLSPGTVVADIVYSPRVTPLLKAARERGLTVVDGVMMLVGQAAEQFEIWTAIKPPLDALFAAVSDSPA